MRKPLAIAVCLLTLAAAATSTAQARTSTTTTAQTIQHLRKGINWQRSQTWHWQDVAGKPHTITRYRERTTSSLPFLHWIARLWLRRKLSAKRGATSSRLLTHRSLWLCIHRGEGSWDSATGNGFYGGLQMTSPWGRGAYYVYRADLLSPAMQMRKAELGYRASGYSTAWLEGQWPNTSPPCLGYA